MRASPFYMLALGKESLLSVLSVIVKFWPHHCWKPPNLRFRPFQFLVSEHSWPAAWTHTWSSPNTRFVCEAPQSCCSPMPGHCPKLRNHQLKRHKMSEKWHHAGHARTPVVSLTLEDHVLLSSRTWERVCRQLGTSLPPGHPQVATHANTDLGPQMGFCGQICNMACDWRQTTAHHFQVTVLVFTWQRKGFQMYFK